MKPIVILLMLILQTRSTVPVTLQVRYLDGGAFERPIQIRNDEGELLQQCHLDTRGHCTIELTRGLYLVEPTGTRLDPVSAAAAVEIGGRWLAITVGDAPLDYAFVIDENKVYFNAAPDALRPQPIRPTQADLAAHFENGETNDVEVSELADLASSKSAETDPTANSPEIEPTAQSTPAPPQLSATNAHQRILRWFLFLLTLTLGMIAIWWITQQKKS